MWCAQVGPKEAVLHLSEWASLAGVENIPPWLASRTADKWGFWIGLIALVSWATVLWLRRRKKHLAERCADSKTIQPDKFVPMNEAATIAYTRLRRTFEARFLDGFGETPESKLIHYASALASKIPVFGRCLPSMEHDEIGKGEFKKGTLENGTFSAGGAEFRRRTDREARWVDLRVRESDLLRAIDEMEKGEESEHPDRWTWPALTSLETSNLRTALKDKKAQHPVHISCDSPQCQELAESLAAVFKRLGWEHYISSEPMMWRARGLLLTPDNETSRVLKNAIEISTDMDIDIEEMSDSVGPAKCMLIIGNRN